jgi:hypothetical protein
MKIVVTQKILDEGIKTGVVKAIDGRYFWTGGAEVIVEEPVYLKKINVKEVEERLNKYGPIKPHDPLDP